MTTSGANVVPGVISRYREFLPVSAGTPALSLGEGGTPLLPARRLAAWVGVAELHLKYEGMNPTGSFKDRGMVVAVARALEDGARSILCASTGNTAASAAAYAAHAGLSAIVLLPEGKVAAGKLGQSVAAGAHVLTVRGNFDAALTMAREAERTGTFVLVNSVNPDRIEGQTTGAYEVCDALGAAPDVLALPVGNGGNITAWWMGFRRYREIGRIDRLPRMLGAQAAGAAPLVHGAPVAEPETVATAIRIGHPATWAPALAAAQESGGVILAATDDEILDAYRAVATLEGVFCEPASAAGVAGLRNAVRQGRVGRGSRCVCVLTGHGLKDPATAAQSGVPQRTIEADPEALASILAEIEQSG
ncbi:MAG: threonine synthase [Gemmatimonadota bacterium]